MKSHKILAAMVVILGVLAGLGAFTFNYAEGFSYLSADPKECANCHVMQTEFDGWQKAGHHHVAVCVDCHLPHSFTGKYMAKASNGWHHSKAFTMQDFHEPIMIKSRNAAVLQENCERCHADLISRMVTKDGRPRGEIKCVHCHSRVGHGD